MDERLNVFRMQTIMSARNWKELKSYISVMQDIRGSQQTYTPDQINYTISRVEEYIKDNIIQNIPRIENTLKTITNTYKIRDKVRELFYIDLVMEAKDFRELYAIINYIKEVKGSKQIFKAKDLNPIIDKVTKGSYPTNVITNTYKIREKVIELLEKQKKAA